MKTALIFFLLTLAACGSKKRELTLSVAGVSAGDIASIQSELAKIPGVDDVRPGEFKDGQITLAVRYSGQGSDLASELAKSGSGLKNVKGFEDASVLISFDNTAAPAAVTRKPEEGPKDPLAYKIHQLPTGTIATFDGWKISPVQAPENTSIIDTYPDGKEKEFVLRVCIATPEARIMANLFELGPRMIQENLKGFQRIGEPKQAAFGGDEARCEEYEGTGNEGQKVIVRVIYVKKQDVVVVVMGFGTPQGHREFGRSIEIVAQSITLKEGQIEPALTGSWHVSTYKSSGTGSTQFSYSSSTSLTIYPNGTFTEQSMSSADGASTASAFTEGNDRGRVIKRGNMLTFHYDGGKVWTAEYKLDGGALMLNGKAWFRQ